MTPLEAVVPFGIAMISAGSAMWLRYYAVKDAKVIRDEATAAAKTLKDEAAAATLTAREAAVAAREAVAVGGKTSEQLGGVAHQLDGRITEFFTMHTEAMEALEKRLVEVRDYAFARGYKDGRAVTMETEITEGQRKIEKTLENQDAKSEARHVELKNGTLNGALNGSKKT